MPQKPARRIQLAPVVALVIALGPASAMAEGGRFNVRVDLEYLYSDIERKDRDTGETTDSVFSRFEQKYNVDLQRQIFPFLEFRTGGVFELIDTSVTVDGPDPDSKETTSSLYAELNLNNPLYTAGTAYRLREREFDPSGFSKTTLSREEFTGLFRWRPVGFPTFNLEVDRIRTWDRDDTVDLLVNRLFLVSRYTYRDLAYDYTYTRNDTEAKIDDSGALTQTHNGGLQYSSDFFNDRLRLTTSTRFTYQSLEPRAEGEIDRPTTTPGAPFFLTDDSDPDTLTEVDVDNPLSDINIGRGGPPNPVAIGLDFGIPTDVSKVHVLPLIDPEETPPLATEQDIASVADDYDWTVFWSDDQEVWTELAVAEVSYAIIENRWEISFARVDGARYIKVVTDPQLDANGEIRTAAIQAFTTLAVSPGMEIEDFDQTVSLGLRWTISDRTNTSYEGFFRYQDSQPFDITRTRLSNSISLRHIFLPKLVASARFLRTDTTETGRDHTVNHSLTASLSADYLDTLRQTLVYSGIHDDREEGNSFANSIFLRTNADLYAGWSSNVDLGFSWRRPIEDGDLTSSTFRLSTKVDPNPKLKFVIDYRFTWNTETGEPSWLDQNARIQAFWVPIRTLSMFAAVRLRQRGRESDDLQVSQDYSVNWSPFPDGLLRLSLGYNQSVDTRDNKIWALSPQVDWRVTRTTLLSLRFNLGTVESDREIRDVKNVRLTFRTYY